MKGTTPKTRATPAIQHAIVPYDAVSFVVPGVVALTMVAADDADDADVVSGIDGLFFIIRYIFFSCTVGAKYPRIHRNDGEFGGNYSTMPLDYLLRCSCDCRRGGECLEASSRSQMPHHSDRIGRFDPLRFGSERNLTAWTTAKWVPLASKAW